MSPAIILAVLILADGVLKLGVKLLLELCHGTLNERVAKDGISCGGRNMELLGVSSMQVVGEGTDRGSLVYRLVLKAHAGLELILCSKVPTACLEVDADDGCEA